MRLAFERLLSVEVVRRYVVTVTGVFPSSDKSRSTDERKYEVLRA